MRDPIDHWNDSSDQQSILDIFDWPLGYQYAEGRWDGKQQWPGLSSVALYIRNWEWRGERDGQRSAITTWMIMNNRVKGILRYRSWQFMLPVTYSNISVMYILSAIEVVNQSWHSEIIIIWLISMTYVSRLPTYCHAIHFCKIHKLIIYFK